MNRPIGSGATGAPAVVVSTPAALREMIVGAVSEALADFAPAPVEGLLDRAELARRLGVTTRSLDRLRREGMPELRVGDVPRWQWQSVLEWLATRGQP